MTTQDRREALVNKLMGQVLEKDYRELRKELSFGWDGGDPYGSLMCAWFPLAGVLHFERDSLVPFDEWRFRPGAATEPDPDDSCYVDLYREYATETLERLGRVFNRYHRMLKHLGETY